MIDMLMIILNMADKNPLFYYSIVTLIVLCPILGVIKLAVEYKKAVKKITDLAVQNKTLQDNLQWFKSEFNSTQVQLTAEKTNNKKLLSQKKSSETRLGQITEQIVPFLDNCPYDPKNMHFLGQPLDYVHFDFDDGKITFIEIKSGNSRASKRQKIVKNMIKSGRVFYDEIRVNTKGISRSSKDK